MFTSVTAVLCLAPVALAQAPAKTADPSSTGGSAGSMVTVVCSSDAGERQHCPADTSAGVLLTRETGEMACLLGRSWGYDSAGVWVMDGCGGEFVVAGAPPEPEPATDVAAAAVSHEDQAGAGPGAPAPETKLPIVEETITPNQLWGVYDPGKGFSIGKGKGGELSISAYALVRYMNQLPADQTFTDHNGNEHPVDARQDIYSHRVLVWLTGWAGLPKLKYTIAFWTVNTTDQDALFGNIGYQFSKGFNLYAGIFGNTGSRSMMGSHPYWLGNDRVLADEFFRPFFTQGLWANGQIVPGLWYTAAIGNTSSTLGVTAAQIDRKFTYGTSVWWMPTTKEFGPRGGYGDWEMHEKVATRFGFSTTVSPEERYTPIGTSPGNTALKLADSLNLFAEGSLAPGVTITNADYRILAVDAGLKYRGFFFQTEFYHRQLNGFVADGALPVDEIVDTGFYVQAAFFPIRQKLELYAATSQIFGDKDAGFSNSSEYLIGTNYYPAKSRNYRLNIQLIDVNRSPVSSTFGYYTGGQDGTTVSAAFSIFF